MIDGCDGCDGCGGDGGGDGGGGGVISSGMQSCSSCTSCPDPGCDRESRRARRERRQKRRGRRRGNRGVHHHRHHHSRPNPVPTPLVGHDARREVRWWSLPTHAGLLAIGAYRRWISPRLPARCRYRPTCSAYGFDAVRALGLVTGARVALARIRRCTRDVACGTHDPLTIG